MPANSIIFKRGQKSLKTLQFTPKQSKCKNTGSGEMKNMYFGFGVNFPFMRFRLQTALWEKKNIFLYMCLFPSLTRVNTLFFSVQGGASWSDSPQGDGGGPVYTGHGHHSCRLPSLWVQLHFTVAHFASPLQLAAHYLRVRQLLMSQMVEHDSN